ncbi:MAG TPA: 2OG-Fe(II) oxygenase [Steroidobacteraceae bacterium]|nr:2OG-Fe(II) oxygenase [Steroidobacteraceae bacterium]
MLSNAQPPPSPQTLVKAARRHSIEGREVRIYDGLLKANEIQGLAAALQNGGFTRTEFARPETAAFRHWVLNIAIEAAAQLPVYQPTLAAAGEFAAETAWRIYRSYCNYAAYGDMLFTHTDCAPGAGELTALWFIAPEWNVEWGGETLFFDSSMDAQVAVSPRPGRLVLFDGSLPHVGRPPNRICYVPRYTLAYKLQPQKPGTAT